MRDRRSFSGWIVTHRIALLLGLVVLVGAVLRLIQANQAVSGDEVSTLWVVKGNSLGETIDLVSSDAEITPPLNFILSWFAVQLGSAPELVRLPALLAGIAAIPLTWVLGRRTVGVSAGLIGATVMALSPYMIFFSGNGRAYTVMILLLLASTIVMLKADESGRTRWWVAYGALSCLAMYSHYTAAFVLAAQLVWLLVARPRSRAPALLANAGAAVLFLPWLSGLLSDLDSPTTKVLEALQGDGFLAKRMAVEEWAFGHPFLAPSVMPGRAVTIAIALGLLVALLFTVRFLWKKWQSPERTRFPIPSGLALILMIGLAAPVGEALLALAGTDLFGARNLTASWYGLALSIGAVLAIPGGMVTLLCSIVVLGGYGTAVAKLNTSANALPDFKGPAAVIDEQSRTGDVVVDMFAAIATPVTLTPLGAHASTDNPTYNLNLPRTPPPFLPNSSTVIDPPEQEVNEAFERAKGHRVFLLAPDLLTVEDSSTSGKKLENPLLTGRAVFLPENATIVEQESYRGTIRPSLYVIDVAP